MAKSLQETVQSTQPKHTLGHIKHKLNGRLSRQLTFIVVEGKDDMEFYNTFFDSNKTFIYPSIKEDETMGGCSYLVEIVTTVLNSYNTELIFGIMDTDSRKFNPFYKNPKGVFLTDHRDMEMTVLSVPRIQETLFSWNHKFQDAITQTTPVVKYQGGLRILNDLFRIKCNFKEKAKIAKLFNEKQHTLYPNWKKRANQNFLKGCPNNKGHFFLKAYTFFAARLALMFQALSIYKLGNDYDVCRGHDMLSLLSYQMIQTQIYSEKTIWEKMAKAYSLQDFKGTFLYQAIHEWEKKHHIQIIK